MKTPTFPNFDTPAGIRAVADHLDTLAADPVNGEAGTPDHVIGHIRIRSTLRALTEAAKWLRYDAPRAGGKRGGVWLTPTATRPLPVFPQGCEATFHGSNRGAPLTGVLAMDAVRHCGSPEAALATIRRQLDVQGESMDPADVKRCERAAKLIEAHIEERAREAEQAAADEAEAARIAKGVVPGNLDAVPEGAEVLIKEGYREYLGKVVSHAKGSHPVLGPKYPAMLHTVAVTHIRETRGKRYGYHPAKKRTVLKDVISLNLSVLPAA